MTVTDDRVQRAIEALEFLAAADIATMDRGGLSDVTAARRIVVGFCDQIDLAVAQRSRQLETEGRSESPPTCCARRVDAPTATRSRCRAGRDRRPDAHPRRRVG